jgi:mannosyltransferase OCH1-like enzyme
MAIPKIIHYCWFGKKPLPEIAGKCIESWRKYFPDWEIKRWDESNYDINKSGFTKQTYEAGKYNLVSDYARCDLLYSFGGIYFDIDVEVIKDFGDILLNKAFVGFEDVGFEDVGFEHWPVVNSGCGMGFEPHNPFLLDVMRGLQKVLVVNEEGVSTSKSIMFIMTTLLRSYGLKNDGTIEDVVGITVYPKEYFSARSSWPGFLSLTENAYSIHYFIGSWLTEEEREWMQNTKKFFEKYSDNKLLLDKVLKVRGYLRNTGLIYS